MSLYENHTDAELLTALRQGDDRSFREIYERYVQRLFGYARARIRDTEECRELVQEAFETLLKSKEKVRQLGPFLFTVLKFSIIKFYEHKRVEKKFSAYMSGFQSGDATDEGDTEIETLRGLVNQSMVNLPQRCQDAVKLRIDENLSLDDIAVRMQVNRESVIRYLTMAMNHFRKEHTPIYKTKQG